MQLADLLADFSDGTGPQGSGAGSDGSPEDQDQRDLATFDKGYRDGWEDAMAAMEQEGKRLHSDFAQNLKDLSFTYREAYSHILAAMEPLLTQIATTILPAALQDSLARHLSDRLFEHAKSCGETLVEIAVAPGELALVELLIGDDHGFPVTVVADGTLARGQADIRFSADHEERIDLTEMATEIRDAITGFSLETRRTAHG